MSQGMVTGSDDDIDFGETLLRVEGLTKHFSQGSGLIASLFNDEEVRAVDDVSFDIAKGETLGLVGESGCGKSTLARTILRLLEPTDGAVWFKGDNLAEMSGEELRTMRENIQMIFQDPQSSLDPRMKVGPIVEEPMKAHGLYKGEREQRARMLLEKVGLDPQHYNRYPHQFSGGQRQRVNLARALAVNPDFIVCDEPTSALDASIQAQVLNTMRDLQEEFGLTYLFISHDLSVIRHISDRVAVMYLGQLVELSETEELFENPQHPYTKALLQSIPVPDPRAGGQRGVLEGDVPSPIDPPSGCRFRTRCPRLIAPEQYDLSAAEWERVKAFMRETQRRTFEADGEASLRNEFFPDGTPDGEAGSLVEKSIDDVLNDDWDAAEERLTEAFAEESICAREVPAYEVEPKHGDGVHFAACHLHNDDVKGSVNAD
ncbi:oligopeptide/dipeptide ABC transporter ATP-binding protein [Halogeometricum pallidum JCM 14848]|uniref:Oligopeptide/dipeptide ABC transporter ATP-binding protein n=1 Tax=Halogeometricum pallidum JCM 14848 TaxID=1227487 RepID=M0DFQ5_HALPD|nr:ABC transporter ATP-binding protein [Halogeometricum pallidum]ELZ33633.1 oligopeptide/dipeptide ABC transporter ATP-binding protein [Halogeometricum pallidum JCM 14848]